MLRFVKFAVAAANNRDRFIRFRSHQACLQIVKDSAYQEDGGRITQILQESSLNASQ
ncbi:uncharacterized protein YbjT (DUF2867 family) [Natronocella acetinitrilica]|uniref:Uncharacterized protein YbjT (DUF2867 family) n=1 Tax=Natronocella acetinitrilica TaxID=414046 RepID=A0AAE3G936_9GAMM|nr:uncharacterized protein YbjT (DUF2867 family) [Natronocella acetinitrilica]